MVGRTDGTIHLTVQNPEISSGQDMVNPEIKQILIIGKSRTVSPFHVGILQSSGNHPSGLRQWRIIEVFTHHHAFITILFIDLCHRISLSSTNCDGICQYVPQILSARLHLFLIGRLQQLLVQGLISGIQLVRLQMIIDQCHRIFSYFQSE